MEEKIVFKTRKGKASESIASYTDSRIKKLFENHGFKVHLKGDPQNPMIVLNDGIILSAYAHNFYLKFTDKPNNGEVIEEIKLTEKEVATYPKENILKILETYEHIMGFRIKLRCEDSLYVVGYSHKDSDELAPVFGRFNPHVYKTMDYAEEIFKKLEILGYPIEIEKYQICDN